MIIPALHSEAHDNLRRTISVAKYLLFGISILATYMAGQDSVQKNRPDGSRANGVLGEQLVTPNDMRAPASAQTALNKAVAAMANNQREEAQKQIEHSLNIYPDYARALTLRGIWNMNSRPAEAMADIEHALRADPAFGVPYAVLASIYNDAHRYEDALPLMLHAVQLLPSAWQVRFEMARTLLGKHRDNEALQELAEATRRLSFDPTATGESRAALHFLCGRILLDEQEVASARTEFELTVKEDPRSDFAKHATDILAKLESPDNRQTP